MFKGIWVFVYQAQKGGRTYCESAKVVLWLSTFMQNLWKETHPATSLLDFFKTGIVHFQSVLIWSDSLSGVDKLKLIAVPLSNQGFRKSAMSSLQARGVVWARRVSLMWLLIALLTFLLFFFLLLLSLSRGVCVCCAFTLPWNPGERSMCVQVVHSALRTHCSRCCASFFLRRYVLIV